MQRKIEDYHDKVLELYNQKLNDTEIGKIINFNTATVRRWRERNNLPPNQRKYYNLQSDLSPVIIDFCNEIALCRSRKETANPTIIMERIHNHNARARSVAN